MNEELKVFKKVEVAMKKLFSYKLSFFVLAVILFWAKNVFILQD